MWSRMGTWSYSSSTCKTRGFTLIELLVVLSVLSAVMYLPFSSYSAFKQALSFDLAKRTIILQLEQARSIAMTTHKDTSVNINIDQKISFQGKKQFVFTGTGYAAVGGSGTITILSRNKRAVIVVSSQGRIRCE